MNRLFNPNEIEGQIIDKINQYNLDEFALVRLTPTMVNKSIIDASETIRKILLDKKMVDYEKLSPGGVRVYKKVLVITDKIIETKASFYRPKTKKGDPRFWAYKLQKYSKKGQLLYLTVDGDTLIVIPVLESSSLDSLLARVFADITKDETVILLKRRLEALTEAGFIQSVDPFKSSPKDVGLTLEKFLGIKVNSLRTPDFFGKIEIKAKKGKTKDSLFAKVPDKKISKYKTVKEVVRTFGEPDPFYDRLSLYNDIITKPNSHGMYLQPDDKKGILWVKFKKGGHEDEVSGWYYETLQKSLEEKHPTTLWVIADEKIIDGKIHFKYTKFQLTSKPQFAEFITLIKRDLINFDWKAHYKNGTARDHGPGFRIDAKHRMLLFRTVMNVI